MKKAIWQLPPNIDKFDAFKLIIDSCSIFDQIPSRAELLAKVCERERIQTTGMGHGVAIAHGKLTGIGKPIVAMGYSKEGLDYDDVFPEKVHFLFVICSDIEAQNDYIKAVSAILSWVHDVDFRADLSTHLNSDRCKSFLAMLESRDFHPPVFKTGK